MAHGVLVLEFSRADCKLCQQASKVTSVQNFVFRVPLLANPGAGSAVLVALLVFASCSPRLRSG